MSNYKLAVLPTAKPDALYNEREMGLTHLPFSFELALCKAIKEGDNEGLQSLIKYLESSTIMMGELASTKLKQVRYWSITVIANAIHYAILGGVDETDAYNLSDKFINHLDQLDNPNECLDYLIKSSSELMQVVISYKQKPVSKKVKQVIHYIHLHLHQKILINELADEVSLSPFYLTKLFKQEMNQTIHEYIMQEKLKEALDLINEGRSYKEVSYILGFSSQSHFISVFKKTYGVTPKEYLANN